MLDTPLDPINAADATFATDNFKAGELIGQWAKATLGDKASTAKIATLDLAPNEPSVDYLRHNGFLTGFGIPVKKPKHYAQSDSAQIVGSDVTAGAEEGGRKAMENILQKAPDIDVVYAINEPAAAGGYSALKAAGKDKGVLVVAIDGGCPGVKSVKEGVIGATSQQYPLLMAAKGVEAIVDFVKTRQEAGGDARPRFLRHRRDAHHRPSGAWREVDRHDRRRQALLGLSRSAAFVPPK